MPLPVGSLIDWSALGKTILYAMVAGVGITVVFSFAILGVERSDQARRAGHGGAATGWTALAVASGLVVLGGVALALAVMARK
jgi:hypothetical protein